MDGAGKTGRPGRGSRDSLIDGYEAEAYLQDTSVFMRGGPSAPRLPQFGEMGGRQPLRRERVEPLCCATSTTTR